MSDGLNSSAPEPDDNAGGGDVPYPDEIFSTADGAARYPLPESLVKTEYESVLTRYVPQNSSLPVLYDARLTERILLSSRLAETTEWGYYNQIAEKWGDVFPGRIAFMRDLLDRLRAALEDMQRLQRQAEQERINLNWRNNYNNERIETDLRALRETWERQRGEGRAAIRETEDTLISYKMSRYPEVEAERKHYFEAREKWDSERDARQQAELERRWKEIEEARQTDRERAAAISVRHAEIWQKVSEAEQAALTAEQAAYEIEQDTAQRIMAESDAAEEKYQGVLKELFALMEAEETQLREEAQAVEEDLLTQKREREAELHQMELSAAEEQDLRERQATDVRVRAERARAAAGFTPDVSQSDQNLHDAVRARFNKEIVAHKTETNHLAFPKQERGFAPFCQRAAKFIALLAFGSVFGISLGLLTGLIVNLTPAVIRRTPYNLPIVCLLGVAIFYLIGRVVYKAWAYAEEERNADRLAATSFGQGRYKFALLAAILLIALLIGIEVFVERYGIVESVSRQLAFQGETITFSFWKEVAYWMIALVVSTPFVLYHAYDGAMETRYRLGWQDQEAALARHRNDAIHAPETIAACEAQGIAQAAQERLKATADDFAAARAEAQRRIGEIDTELKTHPHLVRLQSYTENRQNRINEAPSVRATLEEINVLENAIEHDPTFKAAKNRAGMLRQMANDARRMAESLPTAGELSAPIAPHPVHRPDGTQEIALSWEETVARQRWDSASQAIYQDPQVKFYQNRIKALKEYITSLDKTFSRRHGELAKQQRAVHMAFVEANEQNKEMILQLQDSLERLEAVQITVDEETLRLIQLTDGPALIRWFHNVGQHLFSRSPMRRRLQAAQRRRALPQRAPSVANAILPVRSEP